MNNIQSSFTIQDLEIFTGIKAHTIRIWEKRYGLLNPIRLNRNIRMYSLTDLQKILNITLLYKNDYKISKISKLTDVQLAAEAKRVALTEFSNTYEINSLIISMYTFDENLFEEIYLQQINKINFSEIFVHTYLPLLNHIGLLWQTDSIKPAHEHFISSLIYQKIIFNIAELNYKPAQDDQVYILFLPEGEVHELGLLFVNYYLKLNNKKVVYLGSSIPFDNLFFVNSQFKNITWISYFMIDKTAEEKAHFLDQVRGLLAHTRNKFVLVGRIWTDFSSQNHDDQVIFKEGFNDLVLKNEEILVGQSM